MTAKEMASRIEARRFDTNFKDQGLPRGALCAACGIIEAALREAQEKASGWRMMYRYGLGLAIHALEVYQREYCAVRL